MMFSFSPVSRPLVPFLMLITSVQCLRADVISFDKVTRSYSIPVHFEGVSNRVLFSESKLTGNFDLLAHLQTVFSESSRILYTATRQHAYIGEVVFYLPDDWQWDMIPQPVQCAVRHQNGGDTDHKIRITTEVDKARVNGPQEDVSKWCGKELSDAEMLLPYRLMSNVTKVKFMCRYFAQLSSTLILGCG